MCLVLVAAWFGTRDAAQRSNNQMAVLAAAASLVIASGLVALSNYLFTHIGVLPGSWLNALFTRPRPFDPSTDLTVHLLFYRPTDPSFPSNMAAVVFGMAAATWVKSKRLGNCLLLMASIASFARVFVGIHYPTDILGGFFFGTIATAVSYTLFRLFSPALRWFLGILKRFSLAG